MSMDKTKVKIIELVPEIMELKFGCFVKIDEALPERVTALRTIARHDFIITDVTREWWPVSELNILGRPISLADVLRAIDTTNRSIAVNTKGLFEEEVGYEDTELGERWNLTTDFDGQTQEVKDFIGSLLNV